MNDAYLALIIESIRFSVWAAGEGIGAAKGENATDPEIFLYNFSRRTGHENWEELADLVKLAMAKRKWDEGEHEGCGIDSWMALERENIARTKTAAELVIREWERGYVGSVPMIDALVRLRESLAHSSKDQA